MGASSRAEQQKARVVLDPRTKLLLLLTINVVMLSSTAEGSAVLLKIVMAALAALLLLNAGKGKMALIYIILYALASQADFVLRFFAGTSVIGFLVRFFAQILTRMTPGVMAACYVVATTSVSEFIAAMERMHVSQKIIIPFVVMFRFFPTIGDENRSIQDAMRLRIDFLTFNARPERPSVTVTDLKVEYIPPTRTAVEKLYEQQLDIRIFADDFLRAAAIPKDSL